MKVSVVKYPLGTEKKPKNCLLQVWIRYNRDRNNQVWLYI